MANSTQIQLLCTFTTLKEYEKELQDILVTYKVEDGKVYVLQNKLDKRQIFLTYNVDKFSASQLSQRTRTIAVHRKRGFNVIYSINALNIIINAQGGGNDQFFQIDWSLYANSLVIAGDKTIQVVPTVLLTIFQGKK